MMIIKTEEFKEEAVNNTLEEFREMTDLEFQACENEIMSLPPSRNTSLFKEAYRQVYKEKWGREFPY